MNTTTPFKNRVIETDTRENPYHIYRNGEFYDAYETEKGRDAAFRELKKKKGSTWRKN